MNYREQCNTLAIIASSSSLLLLPRSPPPPPTSSAGLPGCLRDLVFCKHVT